MVGLSQYKIGKQQGGVSCSIVEEFMKEVKMSTQKQRGRKEKYKYNN